MVVHCTPDAAKAALKKEQSGNNSKDRFAWGQEQSAPTKPKTDVYSHHKAAIILDERPTAADAWKKRTHQEHHNFTLWFTPSVSSSWLWTEQDRINWNTGKRCLLCIRLLTSHLVVYAHSLCLKAWHVTNSMYSRRISEDIAIDNVVFVFKKANATHCKVWMLKAKQCVLLLFKAYEL